MLHPVETVFFDTAVELDDVKIIALGAD